MVFALLILNIVFLVNAQKRIVKTDTLRYNLNNARDRLELVQEENNALRQSIKLSILAENVRISSKLINLVNSDSFSNKAFFWMKPKLVFRYKEIGCRPCIEMQLSLLKDFSQEIGAENILVVSSYKSRYDMLSFKKINNFDFSIINIDSLVNEIENISYYFVIDSTMIAKSVFVPLKEIPDLTRDYFKLIRGKYFD